MGVLDDTLILLMLGDNGASAEGGLEGTVNDLLTFNGMASTTQEMLPLLDKLGGPESFPHYPVGWALAMDTPYQWTKQGRVALRRDPQRPRPALAQWHHGEGRGPQPVAWHHVIDSCPRCSKWLACRRPTRWTASPRSRSKA